MKYKDKEKILTGHEPHTTNNRMELLAVINGLKALKRPCSVAVHTDSQYLKNGITLWIHKWKKNGWKTANKTPVKNRDLWEELDRLSNIHTIKWQWIKGHMGHPENERCDKIAKQTIDNHY